MSVLGLGEEVVEVAAHQGELAEVPRAQVQEHLVEVEVQVQVQVQVPGAR